MFEYNLKTYSYENIIFSLLLGTTLYAQDYIVNPKVKWFFGVEMGVNKINSFQLAENNQFIQSEVSAEYYFAKQWKFIRKIKVF